MCGLCRTIHYDTFSVNRDLAMQIAVSTLRLEQVFRRRILDIRGVR